MLVAVAVQQLQVLALVEGHWHAGLEPLALDVASRSANLGHQHSARAAVDVEAQMLAAHTHVLDAVGTREAGGGGEGYEGEGQQGIDVFVGQMKNKR